MRTNKACPMYAGTPGGPTPQPILLQTSEDHEEEMVKTGCIDESDELVNVDGTKIKLSSKVMKVSIGFKPIFILGTRTIYINCMETETKRGEMEDGEPCCYTRSGVEKY